jgi:hypothetical protein
VPKRDGKMSSSIPEGHVGVAGHLSETTTWVLTIYNDPL